jgi:hypothetical protein
MLGVLDLSGIPGMSTGLCRCRICKKHHAITKPKRNGTSQRVLHYRRDFSARWEVFMPQGSEVISKPWHPRCCEVPMWLVAVEKSPIPQHVFECKVCEKRVVQPAHQAAA